MVCLSIFYEITGICTCTHTCTLPLLFSSDVSGHTSSVSWCQTETTSSSILQNMEGVSDFIAGTCRLHRKSYNDIFYSIRFPFLSPPDVPEHRFLCGSSTEFYIEPIQSCIDDVDVMISKANELGCTGDIPVLPDDIRGFFDTITCCQLLANTDYPGFVQLRYLGNMRYNFHYKKFEFKKTNSLNPLIAGKKHRSNYIENVRLCGTSGPAFKYASEGYMFFDMVPCLWCPQWPKEANNWPSRRRNYGWPAPVDIRRIVESGCHVVHARHPACRDDVHQWRLSFSGAELCLIQSFNPAQQIVYHMLRFLAKRELIKKDCPKGDEVLCTYHFKTLMLWSCEKKSPEWWNSSSVVELCCYLLRTLLDWLKIGYCPNYFIPQANLFHESMTNKVVDETIGLVKEFCNSDILCDWFAVMYMMPIIDVGLVLNIQGTVVKAIDFGQSMLIACDIMDSEKLKQFDKQFSSGFWVCVNHTFREVKVKGGYNFRAFLKALCCFRYNFDKTIDRSTFLSTIEFSSYFPMFGKTLFILHAVSALEFRITTHDSEIFTEFIREASWQPTVIRSIHHNFPIPSETNLDKGSVIFLRAQGLMENLTGLNCPQEFKLVSQLSKELLRGT